MPLETLAAQVTAAGISTPTYAEILSSLQDSMRTIYGNDVYIAADSQDGQLIAIIASAVNDANQMAVAVYNAFSPTYAQGAGLSSVVKINNIRRLSSSLSTAVGLIAGVVGTDILNGVVEDTNSNKWNLPAVVTIPLSGAVEVTVTAQVPGAIAAPAGSITRIITPIRGWQSFISTEDAVPGAPVESDATLRRRQSVSQPISAITPLAAMLASLANLDDVQRLQLYENTGSTVDDNGLPGHSICVVIEGGDLEEIAQIIGLKKTPGAATYGTTSQTYIDPVTGIVSTIHFFLLENATIKVEVTIAALSGFSTASEAKIKNAIAVYINGLEIGQPVQFSRIYAPAYLNGAAEGLTYEVTGLTIALGSDPPGVVDLVIPFNEAASCDADADVTVTVA